MRQKSIENQPLRQKPQIRSQDNFKEITFQLACARSQSSNHRYAKAPRPLLGQAKGMLKKWAAPPFPCCHFPIWQARRFSLPRRGPQNSARNFGAAKHLAVSLALA
jgi:hypothetical protein